MDKSKSIQDSDNKKIKVVSISDYKEKIEEKVKRIKKIENGPQPIPSCTCGHHTDPNQFLTEKQVTKHYLKDRKRYVKGLKGKDVLENYMETFKNLMGDAPLVRLNMETDLATINYISNHFNEGMNFYKEYIETQGELTEKAEIKAKELRIGYQGYKEHIVKIMINSYIIKKRRFIRENFDFAWKKNELLTRKDTLDTHLNESEGYIKFMEEHFDKADMEIRKHTLSIVAEKLDRQINEKLNGNNVCSSEVRTLGIQMRDSLDMIKQILSHNRKRDLGTIQDEYEKVKDNCSLEYKAKTLIDIELRNREIDGSKYADESEFTANGSTNQLTKTIGMENLISKLSTKELENLFQQFKE